MTHESLATFANLFPMGSHTKTKAPETKVRTNRGNKLDKCSQLLSHRTFSQVGFDSLLKGTLFLNGLNV